jgi:hypothetical protein
MSGRMAKLAVSAIVAASLLSLKANNAFARNAADSLLATPNITSLSAYQRSESVKKSFRYVAFATQKRLGGSK